MPAPQQGTATCHCGSAWEVLRASLQLGLTAFGGPIAHLGYFERAYVRERRWLSGEEYAGLVALCQILPGPSSSQVGFLIGLHRAGWRGALAAWVGFTLPSALLLFACAMLTVGAAGSMVEAGVHGLKLMAVAVVAQAVWSMGKRLCPDRATAGIALAAAVLLLAVGGTGVQLIVLGLGAIGGAAFGRRRSGAASVCLTKVSPRIAWLALAMFIGLLLVLPILAAGRPNGLTGVADIFYRAGALVFGGGHVVLPLLRDALVPAGWISDEDFVAGYGLAQAVPGPLFTLGAYLGAANAYVASPAMGAVVALIAIFLPGLLLAVAGAGLWNRLASRPGVGGALAGINAAVVGILGAALYDPVWTTAVRSGLDMALAATGLLLLERWKAPPIIVLAVCVAGSVGLQLIAHA